MWKLFYDAPTVQPFAADTLYNGAKIIWWFCGLVFCYILMAKHTEAETKCPLFPRQHLQIHFVQCEKVWNSAKISLKCVPNYSTSNIPALVHWRIYLTLCLNEHMQNCAYLVTYWSLALKRRYTRPSNNYFSIVMNTHGCLSTRVEFPHCYRTGDTAILH